MAAEEDDMPPPLEDMSEALNHILHLKSEKNRPLHATKFNEYLEVSNNNGKQTKKCIEKLMGNCESQVQEKDEQTRKAQIQKKQNEETFCGFKKGFLLSDKKVESPRKGNVKQRRNIIEVKKEDEKSKNIIPEVQAAMTKQIPYLKNQEWISDELLQKILSHPKLSKQFTNPRFSTAIAQFQTNPHHVMQMCQTNAELREFIQDFCAIMGDHFTGLAEKQDLNQSGCEAKMKAKKPSRFKDSKITSTETKPVVKQETSSEEDSKKMQQILSDPEVVSILQIQEIQHLFGVLRTNPDQVSRTLKTADSSLRQKIQKLIDVGLLQFAM